MENSKIIQIFISVLFSFLCIIVPCSSMGQSKNSINLKELGEFYSNPNSSGFQKSRLFLSYQHQIGIIKGRDSVKKSFDDEFEEFRRFWMGLTGQFGDYYKFKVVSQLSNDRNNYPATSGGAYRQWGHETFRAANITFNAGKLWNLKSVDSLEIGYGRRTGRMADEWQRSSTLINCLERSSLANKLWLYDKEKGNPLATWVKWKSGNHSFDTALFSGTYDDYIGGWKDSKVYYASWLGDFSEQTTADMLEFWISYYKQSSSSNEDRLAGGNDWAISFVNRWRKGNLSVHSTLAFGDNGDQSNTDREGSFGGFIIMPMFWLKEDKLKLVGRYVYQEATESEGLKLNSRYAPLADIRDPSIDLNNGRGDQHQAVYIGLNYYFADENLKLVSGVQHDTLNSSGLNQYRGWTAGTSFRIWF